jgi:dTDP-4-dehydrorhamnose 3,5-epimerase
MNRVIRKSNLHGVSLFEVERFRDRRGYFQELYNLATCDPILRAHNFMQDNISQSTKGVLRGLHYQVSSPQGKLITCLEGTIYDVVVDINPISSTYLQWDSFELSFENRGQLWVPPGYAHGFVTLSNKAIVIYKCTAPYDRDDEAGVKWDDPCLNIDWPFRDPVVSQKDLAWPPLTLTV